jgi:hypothetical protein
MITRIVLITLFFISVAVTFIAIYFALKRRYTKAKFAFTSLSALSSLSLLIVFSLLARETPIQSIIGLVAIASGKQYVPKSPSAFELVLICFITFLLHNTVKKMFQNWDGPVSVEDKKREVQRERNSLFSDAIREGIRIFRRQPAPPLYDPPTQSSFIEELEPPEDTLAWHEHARELIILRNPSLEFHPQNGWHEQECCWGGRNIRTQDAIYLGCSLEKPTRERLSKFVQYIKRAGGSKGVIGAAHYWIYRSSEPSFKEEIDEFKIHCESEDGLLDVLVDFSDYYYDVIRRVERDYLPESEITINDVYVESLCGNETSPDEENTMPVEETLKAWVNEPSSRHIALLGEYGQGKSTCTLLFAYHQIVECDFHPHRVPIVVELRGKAPSTMSLDELLATWAVRFKINPVALKKLVIAGRILLIFDGFDEMAFIGQGDARIAHFRALWQFAYPKSKILITGRPNFFLDDTEMRSALGIRQAVPGRAHCSALYLKPFTLGQITTALRGFKENVRAEIHDLADRNPRFYDLASRACLLYIIGVLWERKRSELRQQITSASVIDLFVNYSLDRQEDKARSGGRFMTLRTPERAYFMEGVAANMLTNYMPNQILLRELRTVTLTLLNAIPESVSNINDAMMEAGGKPLRLRIGDDENMLEALHTDIRTYGLLVNDPSKVGTMRFAHKSFMEYLGAKIVAKGIISPEDDASWTLMNTFGLGIGNITMRRETAAFFAESIASALTKEDQKDGTALAESLFRILVPGSIKRNLLVRRYFRRRVFNIYSRVKMMKEYLAKEDITKLPEELEQIEAYINAARPLESLIPSDKRRFISSSISSSLFFNLLFFSPIMRNLSVRLTAWQECCVELGISPDVMASVISPELTVYFEFAKRRHITGKLHPDFPEYYLYTRRLRRHRVK